MSFYDKMVWVVAILVSIFLLYVASVEFKIDFKKYLPDIPKVELPLIKESEESKKKSLEETYLQISEVLKKEQYEKLYDYLLPSDKEKVTKAEFIQQQKNSQKLYDTNYTVHSYQLRGDRGIVDRTVSYCFDVSCTKRYSARSKKFYIYIDGKWYSPMDNTILCDRAKPYVLDAKFSRALDLIKARLGRFDDPETNSFNDVLKKIENCLDIKYSTSDDELNGAEGVFMFTPSGDKDRLQIFVSSRYKINDDILTAILLSHEITHAALYSLGNDQHLTCYENEVAAFWKELIFYATLSDQELTQLSDLANNWQFHTAEVPPEAFNTLSFFFRELPTYSSDGPYDKPGKNKLHNYLKSSSFYQEQCKI